MEIEAAPIDEETRLQPPNKKEDFPSEMQNSPLAVAVANVGMLIWNLGLIVVVASMHAGLPNLQGFFPLILFLTGFVILILIVLAGMMITKLVCPLGCVLHVGIAYMIFVVVTGGILSYFVTFSTGLGFLGYYLAILVFCQWLWKNSSMWIGLINQEHEKL